MSGGWTSKLYLVIGSVLLVGYLASEARGMVYTGTDTKSAIPKGAKSSRGYRSHSFWFIGYHGGK